MISFKDYSRQFGRRRNKRVSESLADANMQSDFSNCDTVRLELTSLTYDCKFKGEEDECLIETNRYIFGKTVDVFNGDYDEIQWDIDIESGTIKGWDSGEVEIYFKVTDGGTYTLMEKGKVLAKITDYVPLFLQIDYPGYNDYVYITIDKDGRIKNWDGKRRKLQIIDFFKGKEEPISYYSAGRSGNRAIPESRSRRRGSRTINEWGSFGDETFLDFFGNIIGMGEIYKFDKLCPDLDLTDSEVEESLEIFGVKPPITNITKGYYDAIFNAFVRKMQEKHGLSDDEAGEIEMNTNPIEFHFGDDYFTTEDEFEKILKKRRSRK